MEDSNLPVLPYIVEILNRSSDMCETIDNLYKEVRKLLAKENQLNKYKNIRKYIDEALAIGQDLGIIFKSNRLVRLPFTLRLNQCNTDSTLKMLNMMANKVVKIQGYKIIVKSP